MSAKPRRAVRYARLSDDPEGRRVGVTNQLEDTAALAERLDWGLADVPPFVDNDIGASTLSKKPRPAFDAMIEGLATGEFDAVLYYSNSRLTRRPAEYELLISLVEATDLKLASVASGAVDLTTADGRLIGRMLAAADAAEAERIGERVKRNFEGRRERDGRPNPCRRSFGFTPGGEQVIPAEADAIVKAAAELIAGASLGDIVKLWTAAGLTPPYGAPGWTRQSVKGALTKPRVAGLISHKGDILGPGNFAGILDRDTRERMCAAIADRSSLVRIAYNGRAHVLAGFLYCGLCLRPMRVNALRDEAGNLRRDSYVVCSRSQHGCGRVKRNLRTLDLHVDGWVRRRLAEVPADTTEVDDVEGRLAALQARIADVEARIAAVHGEFLAGDMDSRDAIPLMRQFRQKLDELTAEARAVDGERGRILDVDAAETWDDPTTPVEVRREILASLVAQIVLHPIGKVGPQRAAAMVAETTEITPA